MKTPSQLFLQLKIDHKEDYLNQQLQKANFKLTKKTGSGIEQFRNYFYELDGLFDACELAINLMPGKDTTKTISINLSPDIHPKHVQRLFDTIAQLAKSTPLDLLDLSVRNRIYEQLRQEGKVNDYYIGLSEEEQKDVEAKAFIPIDYELFIKSQQATLTDENDKTVENDMGERAPNLDT